MTLDFEKNMTSLDYDETIEVMENLDKLLKDLKVDFKWVEGTLSVYPDNYLNTEETSWYINLLYVHNYDNLDPDNYHHNFNIEFNVDFTSGEELKTVLLNIKNNTFKDTYEEKYDCVDLFHSIQKNREKEKEKHTYLDSLSEEESKKIKKHLKKTIEFLKSMNTSEQLVFQLENQLDYFKQEMKKRG